MSFLIFHKVKIIFANIHLQGYDTISMAVIWALYLIGLNANVQEKIIDEIDMIFGNDFERPVTIEDLKDMEYLDRVLKVFIQIFINCH